jgi:hypothetical protein
LTDPDDLQAFTVMKHGVILRGVGIAAPARYPTFATVALDGTPEARIQPLRVSCS